MKHTNWKLNILFIVGYICLVIIKMTNHKLTVKRIKSSKKLEIQCWRTRYGRKPALVAFCRFYGRFSGVLKRLCNRASKPNSRVAERVAPQASLAPSQAPLARGALSERLVPPFLQSVHSPASSTFQKPKASSIYKAQTDATLSAKRPHHKIKNVAILE